MALFQSLDIGDARWMRLAMCDGLRQPRAALEGPAEGGRVLPLPLHPWVIGQPHRIRGLERVLGTILSSPAVWPATGSEILDAYPGQT
jgi:hypothetical protein